MTNFEIVILVWVGILTLQVIQNMNRIEKIGWGMTRKMDKPPAETPMEEYDRKRKERVERLEKEERAKDAQ
jgi:hypothetical protein